MSIRQRIGFAVLAVVVAAVAIVLLRPDESSERADDPGESAAQSADSRTGGEADAGARGTSEPEVEQEQQPAEPAVQRIALEGGQVSGGPQDVTVTSGERVQLVVTSDAPDEVHVHGYDLTRVASPGDPARFEFRANIEGSFEIESHTAEDAGLEALIANLVVEPS